MYYCMSGDRDGSGSPWEMWRKREREGGREGRRKRWMGESREEGTGREVEESGKKWRRGDGRAKNREMEVEKRGKEEEERGGKKMEGKGYVEGVRR